MKRVASFVALLIILGLLSSVPTFQGVADVELSISQLYQHKDTTMVCTVPPGNDTVHAWNHSLSNCPHCNTYCAPASIAMIAIYRGNITCTSQDEIYDNGKYTQGDIPGDGILDSHGVGMYHDNSKGFEVQEAFAYAVDANFRQYCLYDPTAPGTWDWGGGGGGGGAASPQPIDWSGATWQGPLNTTVLVTLLEEERPVLWLDPDETEKSELAMDQGHAKVIAGYYDTASDGIMTADDRFLIYDPWPLLAQEISNPYNITADYLFDFTKSEPYPQLNTRNDVFLVDSETTYPVPEFPGEILSVAILGLGVCFVAIVSKLKSHAKPERNVLLGNRGFKQ